jgi:hypothetical protein
VWVKVWTETPGVRAEQIRITGDVDLSAPKLTNDPRVNWSVDGYGFFGLDNAGHEAILFHIYRLTGERMFEVTSTATVDSTARAQIIGIAKSPQVRTVDVPPSASPDTVLLAVDILPPESGAARGPWSLQTGHIGPGLQPQRRPQP